MIVVNASFPGSAQVDCHHLSGRPQARSQDEEATYRLDQSGFGLSCRSSETFYAKEYYVQSAEGNKGNLLRSVGGQWGSSERR
jgi:hypothetical protein